MKSWAKLAVLGWLGLCAFTPQVLATPSEDGDRLYDKGFFPQALAKYQAELRTTNGCVGTYDLRRPQVQRALKQLGSMYDSGEGVAGNSPDPSKALQCYTNLGDYATARIFVRLGDMHTTATGYPTNQAPDFQKAFNAYWKAVGKGDSGAKIKLGRMYLNGPYPADDNPNAFNNNDRQRYQYAVNLLLESAKFDNPQSQFYLGQVAQKGWGCNASDVRAWGCVKNDDGGSYGTPTPALATTWYEKAARGNYAPAMTALAKLAEGAGNAIAAYTWYDLANKAGDSSVKPMVPPNCWENAMADPSTMIDGVSVLAQDNLPTFVGKSCTEHTLYKTYSSITYNQANNTILYSTTDPTLRTQALYYYVMCDANLYRQSCQDETRTPKGVLALSYAVTDPNERSEALKYCTNPDNNPLVQRLKSSTDYVKNSLLNSMNYKDRCTAQCLSKLYSSKIGQSRDPFWNDPHNASYQTTCANGCPSANPACSGGGGG
jgi:TPR repeat protein